MTSRYPFPLRVSQRVQHAVVRMDRRETVLCQLLGDDLNDTGHTGLVVRPVADDLETVGEVTEGVREIGFQLERHAVRGDGLGDVPGVLVDGRKVAVGVGKGGVYLNGTGVALEGTLKVLHLLEGVPHVAVGVGKVRVYSYGFFVVQEGVLELALHLEYAGEV